MDVDGRKFVLTLQRVANLGATLEDTMVVRSDTMKMSSALD